VLGYIEKFCYCFLLIIGLIYVIDTKVYLTTEFITGHVNNNIKFDYMYDNLPPAPNNCTTVTNISNQCEDPINKKNIEVSCMSYQNMEGYVPTKQKDNVIEIVTYVHTGHNTGYFTYNSELKLIAFRIWLTGNYMQTLNNPNLILTFNNDSIAHIVPPFFPIVVAPAEYQYYYTLYTLLILAGIQNLTMYNDDNQFYKQCPYVLTGVILNVKINCFNEWPYDVNCYLKVYKINSALTLLGVSQYQHVFQIIIPVERAKYGVKIVFDPITGTYSYMTPFTLILAIVGITKFIDYVYTIINTIIKYSVHCRIEYYKNKHEVSYYDGIFAEQLNEINTHLNDDIITHDCSKHIQREYSELVNELEDI
jgi:hypothetical protein